MLDLILVHCRKVDGGRGRFLLPFHEQSEHHQRHSPPITVNELFDKMRLKNGDKKGLWSTYAPVRCGLVDSIPEGRKLHKYSIYGNKTTISTRLSLTEELLGWRSAI
jgi:hypothetical protein